MWEIILAIAIAIAVIFFINKGCKITCSDGMLRENMAGGLGTINSMALYNHANNCHEANAMGSNSAFCTTTGHLVI
jgi:hypothetical protein